MSGFSDPSGPLPGQVYRRRRIVVLLIVAAVIAVIVLIFVRPPADAAAPVVSPSNSAQAPAADGGAAVDPGTATSPVACTPDQVVVTAVTDADSYADGVEPQLSWSLVNSGSAACIINVGTAQQVFTVTSGEETIWKSTDCQSDAQDMELTLEPASSGVPATTSASFGWERVRSSPDTCTDDATREPVAAGGASYHLDVSVGGFSSADTKQFLLN